MQEARSITRPEHRTQGLTPAKADLIAFDEDDLYRNLDWLDAHQAEIEDRLLKTTWPNRPPSLYLYDVTSSYLEGVCNELGAFGLGYNRDSKTGKTANCEVFAVMLAYRIVQELSGRWGALNLTVQEGIDELASVCAMEMNIGNKPQANPIPEPRPSIRRLLEAASVRLPSVLPCKGIKVASRKKLQETRPKRLTH